MAGTANGGRLTSRRRRERLLGAALVAYGALGLVVLLLAALFAVQPLEQLGSLGENLATQRTTLVQALERTSQALNDATTGVDDLDDSLSQARAASASAAQLSRGLSGTMDGLGSAMGVDIFGARPLASLQGGFQQAAGQMRDLGNRLDSIGTALGRNGQDLTAQRANLVALRDAVESLRAGVNDTILPSVSGDTVTAMRIALVLLVLWLGLLALGAMAVGLVLWHHAEPPGERD